MTRALIASDAFLDTDHPSGSLNANWLYFFDTAWQATPPAVSGNKVTPRASMTNQQCARWVGAGTFNADQYSSAVLGDLSWQDATYGAGVVARSSGADATRNCYLFQVYMNGSSFYTQLAAIINNSGFELASTTLAWSNTDAIEIEVEGTAVRGLKNGVVILSATDTSLASGAPGILIGGSAGAPSIDSWAGGNYSTATAVKSRKLLLRVGA